MSTAEQAAAEPVRDRVADRLMLAAVAQRLLGRQAGTTFKIDRFVVLHEIGAGGMGQVFAAYDPQLDRKIALKVVQPHASTHLDKARARLLSEAMALARLSHPNVVTIFEVGEVDREVFLAMEFVEGDDLSGWARKNPVPSPLREDHRMRTAHALLMQAGRGLAAAHAAGLIHRDFKPANVLVGVDSRARVADFGLARGNSTTGRELLTEVGRSTSGSSPITRTGSLLGTPRYMAPEQRRDRTADALTDQFAFCTAAWEVLFGAHPWFGAPPDEELPDPPDGAPVRLVGPLLAGLNPDPAARFRTLDDLLAALEPPQRQSRQPWRWAAAGGLLVLGASAGWQALREESGPCDNLRVELDSIWGAERTPQLRDAVLGSGVPFAETSWKQLERVIDPYVARWAELRTQTCVATLSRVASPTTAATLGCLAQRRRALTAFLDVVAEGTPAAISTAALNAEELPDVALCGEADFVLAGFVTPHGESAAEVEVLQEAIARSAALRRAGEFERAKEAISGHQTRVDALAFPPLAQDYTFERAQLAGALDELSLEESLLLKAYAGAARSGRTSLAAEAAGQLATALAGRGETEAGRRWLAVAETGQSDNGDAALHAALLDRRGAVLLAEGDGNAAAAVYAESLAARESLTGSDSIELVGSILNLGAALEEGGRFEEGQVALDRALLLARQVGNQHPVVASVLHAQAFLASQLSESAQAHALAEEELAIYHATFGNDHPRTAEGMVSLATTTVALGRPEEALALLMQADAIYAKAGPEHRLDRVAGFSQLTRVLAGLGRADEAAMYGEKSLRIRREVLPPSHPDIATGLHNLAYARMRQARYEEALSLDREAGDLIVRTLGREHPNLSYIHSGLGTALMALERYAEAKVEFTRELEVLRVTVGDQHPTAAQPLYNLAVCAHSLGDLDQANTYLTQSLAVLEATSTPDDPQLSYPLIGLARNLVDNDRPAEAIPFAERAIRLVANGDMIVRADARGVLARALWLSRADRTRARELADEAMREYNTVGPEADLNREGLQRWRRKHGL